MTRAHYRSFRCGSMPTISRAAASASQEDTQVSKALAGGTTAQRSNGSRRRGRFAWRPVSAAVAVVLALGGASRAAAETSVDTTSPVQGEKTLEGRLLAPCCWTQTVDIHDSEIARSMRAEIRRRLMGGESQDAIEADFVARYGERIRAVPNGTSLTRMGVWLSILLAVGGLGAGIVVVRWARKGRGDRNEPAAPTGSESSQGAQPGEGNRKRSARDDWDERLDDEIEDMPD